MKCIIDIPDDKVCDYVGSTHLLMPYTIGGHKGHHDTGLKLTLYTGPNRNAIEDEVWEFARKMISTSGNEVSEMWGCVTNFGEVMRNTTYSEAKAKYDEWKKQKDEIRVGDEVIYHRDKYIVGYVEEEDEVYHLVDQCWIRVIVEGNYQLTKTGRHFDEVEELLKKMKEG